MKIFLKKNGTWIAFLLLALIIGLMTGGDLFSARNMTNLVRQVSINGILACGMTLVILTGGIDLSIGSLVALTGVMVGVSQLHWGWGGAEAAGAFGSIALAVTAGAAIGAVNGGLISKLNVAPFVTTLGMMVIARGLSLIISNGSGISPMGDSLVNAGQGYLSVGATWLLMLGLAALVVYTQRRHLARAVFPVLALAALTYAFTAYKGFPRIGLFLGASVGIVYFLLQHTPFGRGVFAVGSNESAAVYAGVAVRKVKWIVYIFMGALAGLAGALVASRQNGASPTAGELAELDAIAAVVIGGTSLKGGTGSVVGSLLGAFIIGLLNNGMDLLGVTSFYQMVFKGLIIIVAVALDKGTVR